MNKYAMYESTTANKTKFLLTRNVIDRNITKIITLMIATSTTSSCSS